VSPSKNRSSEPDTGVIRRHHVHPDTLGRAVKSPLDRLEQARPRYE